MVMEPSRHAPISNELLHTLSDRIQIGLDDIALQIRCIFRDTRLVVLGQHSHDTLLDSNQTLDQLEQIIRRLHIQVASQARLYLRVTGEKQPYASRRILLAPPPPRRERSLTPLSTPSIPSASVSSAKPDADESIVPSDAQSSAPNPFSTALLTPSNSGQDHPEEPWIVGDDELNSLVDQLTATAASAMEDSSAAIAYPAAPTGNPQRGNTLEAIATPHPAENANTDGVNTDGVNIGLITNDVGHQHSTASDPPDEKQGEPEDVTKNEAAATGPAPSTSSALALRPTPILTAAGLIPEAADLVLPTTTPMQDRSEARDKANTLGLPATDQPFNPFQSFTYETSQRLRELSHLFQSPTDIQPHHSAPSPATAHVEGGPQRRIAIATASAVTLGLATGLYGATRPCVVGSCSLLDHAAESGDRSTRLMQQAETWVDIETSIEPLTHAIELLEPVPGWSSHAETVQEQYQQYLEQLDDANTLVAVGQTITQADALAHQAVYTAEDMETVRSLWSSALEELEDIGPDSPLYTFAQAQLAQHHPTLAHMNEQVSTETSAIATLETAQEAAQLAEARQGIAQTLEQWQFARVTWLVALDRLKQIPPDTLAAQDALELEERYQAALEGVNRRVEQEKAIAAAFDQAAQQANIATAAVQHHDWTQAIDDWTQALQHLNAIDAEGPHGIRATELKTQYQAALATAQTSLSAQAKIESQLKTSCVGELQLCRILSIGQSVKLSLDESYLDAINMARTHGNYNLQAVITDHQHRVRQQLDDIADSFDINIEVYTPNGGLLERHIPRTSP